MKTKIVKKPRVKSKKRSALVSSKKVAPIKAYLPGLHQFRLVAHKHTGKLIHHRHTSHLALFVILLVVGFFIYASSGFALATPDPSSGSVTVGAVVQVPPPTKGATITSPTNGYKVKDQIIIDVSGTCLEEMFVVVQDNGITVGSAVCTNAGIFSMQIQLGFGENVLTALNYDNLNQPGPATPSVTITVDQTVFDNTPISITTTDTIETVAAAIPDNPSIIPGAPSTASYSSCDDYIPGNLPTGGPLHVSIVCVPRLFMPELKQTMGVLVWGGTPPYALYVNFGDASNNEPTLISLTGPGYKTIQFSYAVPNTYRIKFRLTDQTNQTAVVQTAVQVNGETEPSSASTALKNFTNQIFGGKPWYESPVPFYLLAIAITLGFWGGDIFDRKYGARTQHRRKKARV
ncbi:MAG: hypothetical protein NTV39_00840 [Candidatus Saccharibacteria bacterium]|nr:hypothetical protein [Candidatus Saccharibacteria bacterium]